MHRQHAFDHEKAFENNPEDSRLYFFSTLCVLDNLMLDDRTVLHLLAYLTSTLPTQQRWSRFGCSQTYSIKLNSMHYSIPNFIPVCFVWVSKRLVRELSAIDS